MGQKWKKNKASTAKAFVPSSHPWATPGQATSATLFYRMCGSWSWPLPVHPGVYEPHLLQYARVNPFVGTAPDGLSEQPGLALPAPTPNPSLSLLSWFLPKCKSDRSSLKPLNGS